MGLNSMWHYAQANGQASSYPTAPLDSAGLRSLLRQNSYGLIQTNVNQGLVDHAVPHHEVILLTMLRDNVVTTIYKLVVLYYFRKIDLQNKEDIPSKYGTGGKLCREVNAPYFCDSD